MNYHFSPGQVAAFLGECFSDGARFVLSRSKLTPEPYFSSGKTMGYYLDFPSSMTSVVLTGDLGAALLTWFRVVFLARTCQPQEKEQESKESDQGFGKRWRESSVRYDPDSSSWKTHHCLFDEDLPWSSVTLPKWGMMRSGVVYQRRIAERPISGTGYGYLPTPTANEGGRQKSASDGAKIRPSLGMMAKKNSWPTPQARDYKDTGPSQGNRKSPNLGTLVHMWPTPTVCGNHNRKGASKNSGDGLATAVKKWGTPRASDGMKNKLRDIDEGHNCRARLEDQVAQSDGGGGMLNPTWVEWLMNWPEEWSGLKPLEMDKFLVWLQQHGE